MGLALPSLNALIADLPPSKIIFLQPVISKAAEENKSTKKFADMDATFINNLRTEVGDGVYALCMACSQY